jgi:Domain of unknown function (DUF4976)
VLVNTGPSPVIRPSGPTHDAGEDQKYAKRWAVGVRTERYLYVESPHGEELYDLALDPEQYDNLADDSDYDPVRAWLQEELRRVENCAGASCAEPMAEPVAPSGPHEPTPSPETTPPAEDG